jgi:hypothetical protein
MDPVRRRRIDPSVCSDLSRWQIDPPDWNWHDVFLRISSISQTKSCLKGNCVKRFLLLCFAYCCMLALHNDYQSYFVIKAHSIFSSIKSMFMKSLKSHINTIVATWVCVLVEWMTSHPVSTHSFPRKFMARFGLWRPLEIAKQIQLLVRIKKKNFTWSFVCASRF